jgi:hypothetical protein
LPAGENYFASANVFLGAAHKFDLRSINPRAKEFRTAGATKQRVAKKSHDEGISPKRRTKTRQKRMIY